MDDPIVRKEGYVVPTDLGSPRLEISVAKSMQLAPKSGSAPAGACCIILHQKITEFLLKSFLR